MDSPVLKQLGLQGKGRASMSAPVCAGCDSDDGARTTLKLRGADGERQEAA